MVLLLLNKLYAAYRMPIADNSQGQRIRQHRSRALAAYRYSSPTKREGGPNSVGTEDSVRSARALGQLAYTAQLPGVVAGLSKSTELPCCPSLQ